MACAILERISGFQPLSETQPSRVLEACYYAQLLPFYLDLSVDVIGVVCHQFGLLNTDLHHMPCAGFVKTFKPGLLIHALPRNVHSIKKGNN